MDKDPDCDEVKRASFFKDWKFWIALLGLVCTVVSTVVAVDRHIAAKNEATARVQAEENAEIARMAEKRAKERLNQLEAEQDSMHKFLINYSAHLTQIRNALSRLKEVQTAKAEGEFWASVDAFISFVEHWRHVQPIFKNLLDGVIDKVAAAALARDKDSVGRLGLQLEISLSDQRLLLEKEIENLKGTTP